MTDSSRRCQSTSAIEPARPWSVLRTRRFSLAIHGPIRAGYLLIGSISVEGVAARMITAQGVGPSEVLEALRQELPATRPDPVDMPPCPA